jgi:hypothetical protein
MMIEKALSSRNFLDAKRLEEQELNENKYDTVKMV